MLNDRDSFRSFIQKMIEQIEIAKNKIKIWSFLRVTSMPVFCVIRRSVGRAERPFDSPQKNMF